MYIDMWISLTYRTNVINDDDAKERKYMAHSMVYRSVTANSPSRTTHATN